MGILAHGAIVAGGRYYKGTRPRFANTFARSHLDHAHQTETQTRRITTVDLYHPHVGLIFKKYIIIKIMDNSIFI